jgi:23S rRNA-/tRNA-specific pseudouridylate synthase/ubiquinone/menaquinone biosynthesis C-methylase UbiE
MAERSGSGDSVFDLVKEYARQKARRRGVRAWIIHRLDKEASGLLVFAKTEEAFMALKDEFKTKRAHRLYAAVVEGTFAQQESTTGPRRVAQLPSGTIHSYLYEDERGIVHSTDTPTKVHRPSRDGFASPDEPGAPRPAVTHFQVQHQQHTGEKLGRALLHVRLETGRKHQIRVHMQTLGKPIVGDRRYGAASDPIGRLCLHAIELGFAHPRTGESVRFRSPMPGTFLVLVGAKRDDASTNPERQRRDPDAPEPASASPPDATHPSIPSADASIAADTDDSEEASDFVESVDVAPAEGMANSAGGASSGPVADAPGSLERTQRDAGWDHVAAWYDKLIDERGSDHHEQTILPGAVRLLGAPLKKGSRVLDLACGQGVFCRRLAQMEPPIACVGIDASPGLIERAGHDDPASTYLVGDARELPALAEQHDALRKPFDAVTCIMAIMNIDPLSPVTAGVAQLLKPEGAFVCVLLHPAFRAMGQTGWVWDIPDDRPASAKDKGKRKGKRSERMDRAFVGRQYRRVDGYLTSYARDIVMNPGKAAHGKTPVTTTTYHRPISAYVRALSDAGLALTHLEEWPSLRQSQPGPRAQEENRARREIPMFLALRAVKI